MPVVVVAAPVPATDLTAALAAVAVAVAAPLGLRPADVVVAHQPLGPAVLGADPVAAWPVVTLHGRRRDDAAMRAAAAAVAESVAASWSTTAEQTWVTWQVPEQLA